MSTARFLIDTSGLFRILQKEHRAAWSDFLTAGVIAVCPVVELEFLFSARSLADRLHKRQLLREIFSWVPMSERAYERAERVQQQLTERGAHRSAGAVDLLIAATAERSQLIVLCDDGDFEMVSEVTGQPVRRVTSLRRQGPAPRGDAEWIALTQAAPRRKRPSDRAMRTRSNMHPTSYFMGHHSIRSATGRVSRSRGAETSHALPPGRRRRRRRSRRWRATTAYARA